MQRLFNDNSTAIQRQFNDYSMTIHRLLNNNSTAIRRQFSGYLTSIQRLHAFFISNAFISNARLKLAKNSAKAKQHPETELLAKMSK